MSRYEDPDCWCGHPFEAHDMAENPNNEDYCVDCEMNHDAPGEGGEAPSHYYGEGD